MNLAQLRYFKNLTECGSYTAAAKMSYVTQPALSSAIRALEQELGFYLIEKNASSFTLTEAGQAFYEASCKSLNTIDRVVDHYRGAIISSHQAKIGIESCELNGSISELICIIAEQELPDISIDMKQDIQTGLLSALKSDFLDIAFLFDKPEDKTLTCTKAISCNLALCASDQSELTSKTTISLHDLTQRKLFTYKQDTVMGKRIAKWSSCMKISPLYVYEDGETLISAVRANKQSSALVVVPLNDMPVLGGLKFIPIEEARGNFFVYAVHKQQLLPGSAASLLKSRVVLRNLDLN